MKGILLAGGSGTRMHPLTKAISKQLLPVYDKPTIYYPLANLMLAGINEILIISTPHDLPLIERLLGDGHELGLRISYAEQAQPNGIAEAILIGKDFIQDSSVCLILGDNIFYGHELPKAFKKSANLKEGAEVYAYRVTDPQRYGVVKFDVKESGIQATHLEEKPKNPSSNWAVTGIYFYDQKAVEYTSQLKPSARGELEITDLNKMYLQANNLYVHTLGRGTAWLDTGTHDSLLTSAQFVQTIEKRQGLKIACLEEIAWSEGFINRSEYETLAENYPKSSYGEYLRQRLNEIEDEQYI